MRHRLKIGQEVKGFAWNGGQHTLFYAPDMDKNIDQEGVVKSINPDNGTFDILFNKDNGGWSYPLALWEKAIIKNEVKTDQVLRKFKALKDCINPLDLEDYKHGIIKYEDIQLLRKGDIIEAEEWIERYLFHADYFDIVREFKRNTWYVYNEEITHDELPDDAEIVVQFHKDTNCLLVMTNQQDGGFHCQDADGDYDLGLMEEGIEKVMILGH